MIRDTEAAEVVRIAGTDPVMGRFGKSKEEIIQLLGPPQQDTIRGLEFILKFE